MCGIAGIYFKVPIPEKDYPGFVRFSKQLILGIEGRGKHATGYVAVDRTGKATMDKADVTASEFINDMDPLPTDPWYVLFHTRYATKGDVKDYRNNHPVLYGTCFTTHNGSIDNDDELFEKHGFHRYAEVDTEILPALVATTDFDPSRIRETFKDVDGSCAMATIDPVNHPGKVLLLRTNNRSPLFLLDTAKYTIWASTQTAMKDAWGKVLGTPPKHTKMKYIPEWKFMILQGQPEAGTYDLIPRPTKVNYAGNYAGGTDHGHAYGAKVKDDVTNEWVAPYELERRKRERKDAADRSLDEERKQDKSVIVSAEEVRRYVRKLREDDLGVATTWDNKSSSVVGRRWQHCTICRNMVLDEDFHQTLSRGRMCCDCADTYNLLYKEKMTVNSDEELKDDVDDGLMELIHKILPGDLRIKMNNWGVDEAQVHGQVMEFLADGTGIDTPVLEYLMFRGNMKDIEDENAELVPLIEKLWDEYDTEYASLWDEVDPSGIGAFGKIVKQAKEGKGQSPGPSSTGTPSSGTRHSHFSNGNAVKRVNNCLFCRKKPKMRLVMADRAQFDFNYCAKHHTRCSVRGCTNDANHTRKDGMRVCHTHARGTKECYADSRLEDMGYSMEAV